MPPRYNTCYDNAIGDLAIVLKENLVARVDSRSLRTASTVFDGILFNGQSKESAASLPAVMVQETGNEIEQLLAGVLAPSSVGSGTSDSYNSSTSTIRKSAGLLSSSTSSSMSPGTYRQSLLAAIYQDLSLAKLALKRCYFGFQSNQVYDRAGW